MSDKTKQLFVGPQDNKKNFNLPGSRSTAHYPVQTLHENPWFRLCNRDGYFTVEYLYPQVTILPIVNNCSILMVRVARPLISDVTLELPGGGAKQDESPVDAGRRELAEETGIEIDDVNRFRRLQPVSICPNRYPSLPHLYEIALTEKEYVNRKKHDNEIASVECYSFEEVVKKICNGSIYIGLHVALLGRLILQRHLSDIEV